MISVQEKDQVEFQFKAAKEQLDAAHAKKYQMVMKGTRYEDIDAGLKGFFIRQKVLLEKLWHIRWKQDWSSPIQGEIKKRITDPGEMVAAGYPGIYTC